jgi:hypothetical protein
MAKQYIDEAYGFNIESYNSWILYGYYLSSESEYKDVRRDHVSIMSKWKNAFYT